MYAMNTLLTALIAIGVGLAVGHLLFESKGDTSMTLYSAYGTLSMTFGVIIGIFLVIGGFRVIGAIFIMVAYFLARGNYNRFKSERSTRAKIANR